MGMTIDVWGPAAWNTLHAFAHSVPSALDAQQQADFVELLYLFGAHLPCPKCRTHFSEYLDTHVDSRSFSSRASVVQFVFDAHNDVNVRLGKRSWTLVEHVETFDPAPLSPASRGENGPVEADVAVMLLVVFIALMLGLRMWLRRDRAESGARTRPVWRE